jgi:hypothetical protein
MSQPNYNLTRANPTFVLSLFPSCLTRFVPIKKMYDTILLAQKSSAVSVSADRPMYRTMTVTRSLEDLVSSGVGSNGALQKGVRERVIWLNLLARKEVIGSSKLILMSYRQEEEKLIRRIF